jgi:hypothetical protein
MYSSQPETAIDGTLRPEVACGGGDTQVQIGPGVSSFDKARRGIDEFSMRKAGVYTY